MRLLLVAIVVLAAVVGVGHAELVLDISALRSQLGGYAALGAGASLSLVDYNKLVAVAFQDWGGLLNDRLRKELSRSGVGNTVDVRSRIATASALGVPSDMVIAGGSTLTGNGQPDIYYLNAGNQTVNASAGDDNFVMGAHFGQDVINAVQGGTSIANALAPATGQTDILRFTSLTSTDVTASRSGEDLIIKVNGTGQQVTVTGQFIGNDPACSAATSIRSSASARSRSRTASRGTRPTLPGRRHPTPTASTAR